MSGCPFATRRGVLGAALSLAGASAAHAAAQPPLPKTRGLAAGAALDFHGAHQNGIATPRQASTYFAAFDVTASTRADLRALLRGWSDAAGRLCAGKPADAADSGEVAGLPPSRLTLTFGLGASLFSKDGVDRFGLAHRRPAALVDLPTFPGDQLIAERTGGDISVQACGDDPQATMHAIRQLTRLGYGAVTTRWVQAGFLPGYAPDVTPRNLMGFKDGSFNVPVRESSAMERFIWAGLEGGWMQGGTYLVVRPIRIALEHWDRMTPAFQEKTVGRQKASGAQIGTRREFGAIALDGTGPDGDPLVAENAHVRLGAPQSNGGAQILRRAFSYDNGVSMIAERWPPWRHAMEMDAGLLFICYQRDPRSGFIRIFDRMSRFDMLNQFVTHVGGGLFACPPGVRPGEYVGQELLEG